MTIAKSWNKNLNEAAFGRYALLLSFCENRFCLSQFAKKLNLMERGAFFRHFCVSKVITIAHAHKSGVIVHIFPRAFIRKKIKELRPKMIKIASRGGGGGGQPWPHKFCSLKVWKAMVTGETIFLLERRTLSDGSLSFLKDPQKHGGTIFSRILDIQAISGFLDRSAVMSEPVRMSIEDAGT